jgi:hypothetical protein
MLSVGAPKSGGITGMAGIVGIVDVIVKTFLQAKNIFQASKKVADAIGRIIDICENVKKLLNRNQAFAFPKSIIDSVESTLEVVRDIAEKYKNNTFGVRIQYMPKALGRLNELDKVENRMQTVLTLITGDILANTEGTVKMMGEVHDSLDQVLVRDDIKSARIETAISDAEKICGPLADLALDDKVEEILQRFDDTLQDIWVCNYSSVPATPSYAVETQHVRNLYKVLLDEPAQCRVVTAHGWGGVGKTFG